MTPVFALPTGLTTAPFSRCRMVTGDTASENTQLPCMAATNPSVSDEGLFWGVDELSIVAEAIFKR